ncbi:SAV_6107 family HEPN domain-containing protein [Peterkaempfera bronchialis]|uniref:SAV_6107 family HEPN domain-containing protein n=1 Tax=Peterkaempfera bronchialis TaxID=2126346 RepID=UPI003C2F5086
MTIAGGDARILRLGGGPPDGIFPQPQLPQQPQPQQQSGRPVGGYGVPYRRPSDVHPVLRRAAAPPAALDLLTQAHRTLAGARACEDPLERYAAAHLAALRTSAAVLAVRGRPEKNPRRRKAIRSAWEVLPEVAPELAEWAVYFAAGARKRAAAEAGIQGAASPRDADDLVRNTALFLRIVERLLSLRPAVPAPALPLGDLGDPDNPGDPDDFDDFDDFDSRDGGEGGGPPMPRTG